MDVDPAASFRCWEIEVRLGGRVFIIPALPAADWLPPLMSGRYLDVVPGMVTESEDLDDMIIEGVVTAEQVKEAAVDAIEQAAGRSMYAAMVLSVTAAKVWTVIGGKLSANGFRFDVMPLGAALDAIYATVVGNLTKKEDRDKFIAALESGGPAALRSKGGKKAALTQFSAFAGPPPKQISNGGPSGGGRPKTRQRRPVLPPVDRSG